MLPTPGARSAKDDDSPRSPPAAVAEAEGVRELRPGFGCFAGTNVRLRAGWRGDGARGFDTSFASAAARCALLFLPLRRFVDAGVMGGGGGIALASSCSFRRNGVDALTGDLPDGVLAPVASFKMRPSKSFRANLKPNMYCVYSSRTFLERSMLRERLDTGF